MDKGTTKIISTDKLIKSVAAFKESLKLPTAELRRIEQETRDQSRSSLWFSQCKYRITASFFGEIFKRLPMPLLIALKNYIL